MARLARLGNGVDGVVTEQGETVACEHLVLATDAPATARLLEGPPAVPPALGTTVVYLSTKVRPYERAMLTLPAGRRRLVRHFVALTNVAPEYAPPGQHLLSATVLDRRGMDDAALSAAVTREIAEVYPGTSGQLNPVAVIDVPYAQHRQPAGFARGRVPAPTPAGLDNVWLAGDQTGACSIQSSMVSGERAAAFLAGRVRR